MLNDSINSNNQNNSGNNLGVMSSKNDGTINNEMALSQQMVDFDEK